VRTTEAQRAVLGSPKPRGIGYGIGLAVALFVMQGISTFDFSFFLTYTLQHRIRELGKWNPRRLNFILTIAGLLFRR